MGAAGSLPALPDTLDAEKCKSIVGDKFNQAAFDSAANAEGVITKAQFVEAFGAAAVPAVAAEPAAAEEPAGILAEAAAAGAAAGGAAPDMTPVDAEVQKKFHSMCRWNKPAEEVQAFVDANPGCQNSQDPGNGNYPLHIASQNGHRDLVRQLIEIGVNVDAQNGTGTTALHMSKAYDYFWSARLILAGGADPLLKNNDGHTAQDGIEGDKDGAGPTNYIPAMTSAHSIEELQEALDGLLGQETVDKGELVMGGMQKKKSDKALWTAEIDAKFKEVCKSK
jgi:hypothetical protein